MWKKSLNDRLKEWLDAEDEYIELEGLFEEAPIGTDERARAFEALTEATRKSLRARARYNAAKRRRRTEDGTQAVRSSVGDL